MNSKVYLPIDLGAGSGPVIAGLQGRNSLRIEVIRRFPNKSQLPD